MREYETTYVLNQSLNDTDVKGTLEKIGGTINRHGGMIFAQKNLGKKSLAYRINKQTKGIYAYVDYCGDNTTVSEIERYLKLNEQVLRYLTVKLNEDVNPDSRVKEIAEEEERLAKAYAEMQSNEPTLNEHLDGNVVIDNDIEEDKNV